MSRRAAPRFESANQAVEWLAGELARALPDSFAVSVEREKFRPGSLNRQSWKVLVWKVQGKTGLWAESRVRSQVVLAFGDGSLWENFEDKPAEAYGLTWDGCEGLPQVRGTPSEVLGEVVEYARGLARKRGR